MRCLLGPLDNIVVNEKRVIDDCKKSFIIMFKLEVDELPVELTNSDLLFFQSVTTKLVFKVMWLISAGRRGLTTSCVPACRSLPALGPCRHPVSERATVFRGLGAETGSWLSGA